MSIQIQILGDVAARDGEARELVLGGPTQRRLLAALVLRSPAQASTDWLIEAVWPDAANRPERPHDTIRTYVARLRKALGEHRIETGTASYRLDINGDELDAWMFERLVRRADRSGGGAAKGAGGTPLADLDVALKLWRGQVFGSLGDESPFDVERRRLDALRIAAVEHRMEIRLRAGEHRNLVGELEALVREYPLREQPIRLLMIALHRSGAQAEALRVYQRFRSVLAEETGLEPTADLSELEQRIMMSALDLDRELGPESPNGYELHEVLIPAGAASVHRATQMGLDREVTIRVIGPNLADRPEFIRRFEVEAQELARLEHPDIVPLLDYWRDPGGAFLVSRHLTGGTLADRLQDGPQSSDDLARWLIPVGNALHAAHRSGIAHGDLRPENIVFDSTGKAYLAQFCPAVVRLAESPVPLHVQPADTAVSDQHGVAVGHDLDCLLTIVEKARSSHGVTSRSDVRRQLPQARDAGAMMDALSLVDLLLAESTIDSDRSSPPDAITEESEPETGRRVATPNPFRGLRAFDETDAAVFFGRETEVEDIVTNLEANRFVAVVGPSGCGKSSIVRGGVIPAVRNGTNWFVVALNPGRQPYAELEAALRTVIVGPAPGLARELREGLDGVEAVVERYLPDPEAPVLIVIDQFEELYTLVDDPTERELLVASMVESVDAPASRLRFLVTIRADFFDRPLRHARLGRLVTRFQQAVLPLSPPALEQVISGPARSVGVSVEPSLVAEMVSDMAGGESSTPMLQYTLTELFERRGGTELALDDYRDLGGLSGAIASRAETVFGELDTAAQEVAPEVFQELVSLGEGTEDTRRRIERTDLKAASAVDQVLDCFGRARLLTFDHNPLNRRPTVEVAHEALIRHWPRLRGWIDDNRDTIRLVRQVDAGAAQWEAGGHDPADLYRGGRLAGALQAIDERPSGWSERSRRFIEVSADAERREREAELVVNRRLRRLVLAVGAVAIVAIAASVVAISARQQANQEAEEASLARAAAETRRLSADAAQLARSNRRVALLLAAEAYNRDRSPDTLAGLQSVLIATPGFRRYLGAGYQHRLVAWIDNNLIVAARDDGLVVYSADSGDVTASFTASTITELEVDPERRLAAVGIGSEVVVLDQELSAVAGPFDGPDRVDSLAFGPSDRLAIGYRDGTAVVRTLSFGSPVATIDAHPEQSMAEFDVGGDIEPSIPHQPDSYRFGVEAIAVSADGATMITGSLAIIRVWDVASESLIREFYSTRDGGDGAEVLAGVRDIEPIDNEVLVASGFNVQLRSLDGTLEDEIPIDRSALTTAVPGVDTEVRLDGAGVSVAGSGGIAALFSWDGTNVGEVEVQRFDSQLAGRPSAARSPDGRHVVVGAEDGLAVFSTDGSNFASQAVEVGDAEEVTVVDDGSMLAASRPDGNPARLVSLEGAEPRTLKTRSRAVPDFAWVGFGSYTYGWQFPPITRLTAFDENLEPSHHYPGLESVITLSASPDGRFLAAANEATEGSPSLLHVFDDHSGEAVASLDDLAVADPDVDIRSIGFSHDGRYLAAANDNGAALIWETETWQPMDVELSGGGGGVVLVKYSPDDEWLVTIGSDGVIALRDPSTLQPMHRLTGNSDGVSGLSHGPMFTEDGRYMVTTSDGLGRIWDLDRRTQVGSVFPSDPGTVPAASKNARFLATIIDGQAVVWDLDVDRWFDHVCRAAGRNLTVAEWEQFGPVGEDYRPTCPQWDNPSSAAQN